MKQKTIGQASYCAIILLLCIPSTSIAAPPPIWTRTIASPDIDFASRVETDFNGDVIVAGETAGTIGGAHVGGYDAFVRKFSSSGAVLWTRQFGGGSHESVRGLAVDGAGGVVVAGAVEGLAVDLYLRKYDATGGLSWSQQYAISGAERATNLAMAVNGELFVSNYDNPTPNALEVASLRKFSQVGAQLWTRTLSSASSQVLGLGTAVDSLGNSYLAGQVANGVQLAGSAGPGGAFLAKYDGAGNQLWLQQFGAADSSDWDIATDALNNLYVTGYDRSFNTGYLKKLDGSGNLLWTVFMGGGTNASRLDLDASGNLYVGGFLVNTYATYSRFLADGSLAWTRSFDSGYTPDIAADGMGHLYVYDTTFAANSFDTLLLKDSVVPEPNAASLLCVALMACCLPLRKKRPCS